jgi:hypothetical protein
VVAFASVAVIAACITIDYGIYLTDDIARKMHGKTVNEKASDVSSDEK